MYYGIPYILYAICIFIGLPKFELIYRDLNIRLPNITMFFVSYSIAISVASLIVGITISAVQKTDSSSRFIHFIVIPILFVGTIIALFLPLIGEIEKI